MLRIKEDLTSGKPTLETLSTIQALLHGQQHQQPDHESSYKTQRQNSKPRSTDQQSSKLAVKISDFLPGSQAITTKQKRRLATEVASAGAELLSKSLITPRDGSGKPRQPLRQRSGNTTPSPRKHVDSVPIKSSDNTTTSTITIAAECTHSALIYLRANSPHDTHLLEATLAFSRHLLAHKMVHMALVELSAAQAMLQGSTWKQGAQQKGVTSKISGCLNLNIPKSAQIETLRLAIVHQTLVLKATAMSRDPGILKDLALYVSTASNTPDHFVLQWHALSLDSARAAAYLEVIASELLALCPKLSQEADGVPSLVSSLTAFRFQAYALSLRRTWWTLTKHNIDIQKTLSDQFLRMLRTLVRRIGTVDCYEVAKAGYMLVFGSKEQPVDASADVLSLMRAIAGESPGQGIWAEKLNQSLSGISDTDCRKINSSVQSLLTCSRMDASDKQLAEIAAKLEVCLQGRAQDYTALLANLGKLIQRYRLDSLTTNSSSLHEVMSNTLRLALWSAESHPDADLRPHRSVLCLALRMCPRAQLIRLLDDRAMNIMLSKEVLDTICRLAATNNLKSAYMANRDTITVGELIELSVLQELQLNDVRMSHDSIWSGLSIFEQIVLLEWRLRSCLKHMSRSTLTKQQESCKKILTRLDKLYSHEHPLRRAITSILLELARSRGSITHVGWPVSRVDMTVLMADVGLKEYTQEITGLQQLVASLHGEEVDPSTLRAIVHALDDMISSTKGGRTVTYDISMLTGVLSATAAFQHSLYHDEAAATTYILLTKLSIVQKSSALRLKSLEAYAEISIQAGHIHEVLKITPDILQIAADAETRPINKMQAFLILAQISISQKQQDEAARLLEQALNMKSKVDARSNNEKRQLALACAIAWHLRSQLLMLTESVNSALRAAKVAASIINSIWRRSDTGEDSMLEQLEDFSNEDETRGLSDKISKLQLKPQTITKVASVSSKGPDYWELIPLACRMLMFLSTLYTHIGSFSEAHFYALQAVKIADAIPSSSWSSTTRLQLAELLTASDRFEDAEMCLEKAESSVLEDTNILKVRLHQARARLHKKRGEPREALEQLNAATKLLHFLNSSHRPWPSCPSVVKNTSATLQLSNDTHSRSRKARSGPVSRTKTPTSSIERSLLVSQLQDAVDLDKHMLHLSMHDQRKDSVISAAYTTSKHRQFAHLCTMSTLVSSLEMHVVYNTLLESTLLCPGVKRSANPGTKTIKARSAPKTSRTTKKAPTISRQTALEDDLHELKDTLTTAELALQRPSSLHECNESNADLVIENSMLLKLDILAASSLMKPKQQRSLQDTTQLVDFAASLAKYREQAALLDGADTKAAIENLDWPSMDESHDMPVEASSNLSAILPYSWTVASLSLSHDKEELIITRYQRDVEPSLVKLPFLKHDLEVGSVQSFSFSNGKAELQDIIEQSNSICHAGNEPSKSMTTGTWWKRREELDRRLYELLVNIEEIWLGGFKSMLSPVQRTTSTVEVFRVQFAKLCERYLSTLQKEFSSMLSDSTLTLLLDLCYNQPSTLDIDSAVLDILYAIVDTFRFNGQQIAYDEVDFDSWSVETIDILQEHHKVKSATAENRHLILVLDKHLQNFPWESLPYLENTSITRIGDTLSLKDRILRAGERPRISSGSGSILMDPASDMKRTRDTMQPVVNSLEQQYPAWKCISDGLCEDNFRDALINSSISLYFGHGAGSQHIRSKTIKKLHECSEVVWLMGCSSGTVVENGEFESSSIPATYLLAGARQSDQSQCLSVVANLWDVTDKDIDRFSIAAGQEWGLWNVPEVEMRTSGRRKKPVHRDALVTPPLSPKTPRAKPTRVATTSKTPVRSKAAQPTSTSCSLSEAVARSRDACYLRYLNGAAPVVYGIPVYLD